MYLACVAAADASLRLHETAAARRWLDQAPEAFRGREFRYLRARADESSMAVEAGGGPVNGVDVSPDGKIVATASTEGAVKIWDARTGALRATLAGHTAAVWTAKFSPDGRRLATSSSDGTVRVWDVGADLPQLMMTGVGRGIAAVAWHPSGEQLASGSWIQSPDRGVLGVVKLWDASTGKLLREIERAGMVDVGRSEDRHPFPRHDEEGPAIARVEDARHQRCRKPPGRKEKMAPPERPQPGGGADLGPEPVGPDPGRVDDRARPDLRGVPGDGVPQGHAGDPALVKEQLLGGHVVERTSRRLARLPC